MLRAQSHKEGFLKICKMVEGKIHNCKFLEDLASVSADFMGSYKVSVLKDIFPTLFPRV